MRLVFLTPRKQILFNKTIQTEILIQEIHRSLKRTFTKRVLQTY